MQWRIFNYNPDAAGASLPVRCAPGVGINGGR